MTKTTYKRKRKEKGKKEKREKVLKNKSLAK